MRVFIKGTNVRVPQAVKEYAESKINKLERYARFIREATVAFSSQRSWFIAEITMTFGDTVLRAEEKSNDMYVSVDLGVEKVESQLKKLKGRMAARSRQSREQGTSDEAVEQFLADLDDEEVEELADGRVVRTKTFPIKPMTTEEAILQMQLVGHDFFVFYQAENGQPAVVYERHDGNFGLLVPEAK